MTISEQLFQQSSRIIPGGVNSPVRAFGAVGGTPPFIKKAKGARIEDEDGNQYIDYVASWGPMILGHAPDLVVEAVQKAAADGLSFGAPTRRELELAETICNILPSVEQLRLVSTGTEATMTAIRLARGFTGRERILKFEGCYHGHSDGLLVKAGSGALTFGVPTSAGVPVAMAELTSVLAYNDVDALKGFFANQGDQLACVIVEPVAGNMGCVPGSQEFLQVMRDLCDQHGAVLIFDEVMSGFRVALGGAQALTGIKPDLTTLGKVIGGGMPIGALGGRQDIMAKLAPIGPVYQAGTLSGNPLATAAGLATLQEISKPGFFAELSATTGLLVSGLASAASAVGVSVCTQQVGAMFGLFFTDSEQVTTFSQVMACDVAAYNRYFHAMLDRGIYLAPSAYEAAFVSSCHGQQEIETTVQAASESFKILKGLSV